MFMFAGVCHIVTLWDTPFHQVLFTFDWQIDHLFWMVVESRVRFTIFLSLFTAKPHWQFWHLHSRRSLSFFFLFVFIFCFRVWSLVALPQRNWLHVLQKNCQWRFWRNLKTSQLPLWTFILYRISLG